MTKLALRFEASPIITVLPALAEVSPEFGQAVLDLLDAGEELFSLKLDDAAASFAGEVVVRLDPSHGLLVLVSALRARNPELLLFEHLPLQVFVIDSSTTQGGAQ